MSIIERLPAHYKEVRHNRRNFHDRETNEPKLHALLKELKEEERWLEMESD